MFKRVGHLSAQIRIAVAILGALAMVAAISIAYFAAKQADKEAMRKQYILVDRSFAAQFEMIEKEQKSVSIADDFVGNARMANRQWFAENVGEPMYNAYGHDRAMVLNDKNEVIYVMRDGKTAGDASLTDNERVILDAAAELRDRLVARREFSEAVGDRSGMSEARLVMLDEVPALLSIQPILPSTDRTFVTPGKEYLYASVQYYDEKMAQLIGSWTLIDDGHFSHKSAKGGQAGFVVSGADGQPFVNFNWNADRPGRDILQQALPVGIAAFILIGGIAVFLSLSLRQASGALVDSERRARHLATHDVLTRLPNRGLFEDRLSEALVKVRVGNCEAAVLFMDLDRFKNINDTLGHRAGDELVRQVGVRLSSVVGTTGTVARIGGDEFGMVLLARKNAAAVAVEISEALLIALHAPFHIDDEVIHIGVSIGIAVAPEVGNEREEMLRKADIALYEAKKKGRGCYQIFSEAMGDVLKQRRLVEVDLRSALASGGELQLYYQPLYYDDSGLGGAEALLRWHHPVHGNLSPQFIISIAEESGLIMQLGDWILAEACRMAIKSDVPLMSVNISGVQLRDKNFAERCLAIIRQEGLAPSRIQVEVTETVLIENPELAIETFSRLRKAGVRVAIDDFGTGYSSMSYLQNYPVDRLKIDRSFIQAASESPEGKAIVGAMLEMARALKLDVIAEGVETAEQCRLLRTLGCHFMQGYLFSRPLASAQFLQCVSDKQAKSA